MVSLRQDRNGNFRARKRLPDDVREEYGRRFGQKLEAKFFASAKNGAAEARQLFRDWDAEVDGRIAAIRAERTGEGVSLTPQQARALAGEWYEWFLARHPARDGAKWEAVRDQVHEALREAAGDQQWERGDPDDLWRDDPELRRTVRPALADVGETAQFLSVKRLVLNNEARARFLDWLYEDLAEALRKLMRVARGDYEDSDYSKRFPKFSAPEGGQTPQQLFEAWAGERKPARGTVESWQYVFAEMATHFKDRSAASISPDEAQDWIKSLDNKRTASTIRKNWIAPCKAVFRWAVKHKRVPRNPFTDVTIEVPRKRTLRDTKAFLLDEWHTILQASLAITETRTPDEAARRWVPWLCAYSGARPAEITQLRATDVIEREGINALRITPEAGTVKNKKARVVPLHEHLIAQGFLTFVAKHRAGPLFYRISKNNDEEDPLKTKKPRYIQARQRLADWVRSLGITDNELSPNHAWRHTFKQRAARAGIEPRTRDAICGHSPRSVADEYEMPSLGDMAEALKKFPRYEV
jgi:integrase